MMLHLPFHRGLHLAVCSSGFQSEVSGIKGVFEEGSAGPSINRGLIILFKFYL